MTVYGQRSAWKKLGYAEKRWVLTHPFIAKKAYQSTQQVSVVMDSLKANNFFEGNTSSGSQADAVRHAYWMAGLSAQIGTRRALKLGKAHEKKNKRDFKQGNLEDQFLPDAAAMDMDLRNNEKGAEIGQNKQTLLDNVLKALKNGELCWIKQNENGEFLDKNNQVIPLKEWSGKWDNERVLTSTN
ncbi:MAG: hypothetical protein ACJAV5_000623 [Vicingaceae bacterium]|jgi:hypothetical protein